MREKYGNNRFAKQPSKDLPMLNLGDDSLKQLKVQEIEVTYQVSDI